VAIFYGHGVVTYALDLVKYASI